MALEAAAKLGNYQVVLILLKAGANINAEFNGFHGIRITALLEAVLWGRLDMVHLLLKAGADLHLPEALRYVEAAKEAYRRGYIAIASIYCFNLLLQSFRSGKQIRNFSTNSPRCKSHPVLG